MVTFKSVVKVKLLLPQSEDALDCAEHFRYLASMTTSDAKHHIEIRHRIGFATAAQVTLGRLWRNKGVTMKCKMQLLLSLVFSILLYACEIWMLRKQGIKWLSAFELKWYR